MQFVLDEAFHLKEMHKMFVTKILKNKIHPGSRLIFRISKKLDIPEEEVTFFFQDLKKQQNNSYEKIALDTFAVISDWQHFAILELMKIEDFQPQAEWISHKLGLSLSETEKSIQRLFDLELILLDDQGQWVDSGNGYSSAISDLDPQKAILNHQKQVLEMALNALKDCDSEYRANSSLTIAIDKSQIPKAKEMIRNFRRRLDRFLGSHGSPNSVYHLGVFLYPITQLSKEKT